MAITGLELIQPGPDPEQTVDRKQPTPTRPLPAKNMQLMTESEVFQFKNGPTAEPAGDSGHDGMHMLEHAATLR